MPFQGEQGNISQGCASILELEILEHVEEGLCPPYSKSRYFYGGI